MDHIITEKDQKIIELEQDNIQIQSKKDEEIENLQKFLGDRERQIKKLFVQLEKKEKEEEEGEEEGEEKGEGEGEKVVEEGQGVQLMFLRGENDNLKSVISQVLSFL